MAKTPKSNLPGKIGRFRIERELARGGRARVMAGFDPDLKRAVAIKLFAPSPGSDADTERRRAAFVAQAKRLDAIDHPNVVPVIEYDLLGRAKAPYYAMPLAAGDLRALIGRDADAGLALDLPAAQRPRALSPAETVAILSQILDGLAALQAQGLPHGDVSPANILLDRIAADAQVRLTDPSAAKEDDRGAPPSGTWDYASPEHKDGLALDARADVFAVGVLAYRMLTGRLPEGAAPPPRAIDAAVPEALEAWLLRALSTARAERFADAAEMRAALPARNVLG